MSGLRRLSTNIGYEPRGAMVHRITLLKDNSQRNTEGEFLSATDFADTWASIKVLQGRELEKLQQIVAEVTHKIVIPYQDGVIAGMRIQFGKRIFQIEAVQDPDERKVDLILLGLERNDGRDGEQ
jgi:SPP1 family predicted phage head-tail adaptor